MGISKTNSIFHGIDLSLLKHFFAIATFRGFSAASRATGVSQPALSLGLQKLEKSLGVVLVNRSTRPFQLTKAGLSLLTFCQRVQGQFESVIATLGGHEIELQRRFRIGTALSIGFAPLDALCARAARLDRAMELELIEQNTYQLLDDVADGKLDGAFIPEDVYDSRLTTIPLVRDRIIFIVGPTNHEKIAKKNWRDKLAKMPLVTYPRETPMRAVIDKICLGGRLQFETHYSVNSIEALKKLVKNGRGGAFVLRVLVEAELKSKELFEEKLPVTLPKSGISFVHRTGAAKRAGFPELISLLDQ